VGAIRRLSQQTLPPGALAVGGGLLAASATTYGFLAVSARALGPGGYAPISVLWSALFIVTATVWMPVEQEVARLVGARTARDEGARPVAVAGARATLVVGAPCVVLVAGLAVAGVDDPVPYAAAVAIAPLVPVVAFRRRWGSAARPGPPSPTLHRRVLPLAGSQALAQLLVNGGPIAVALLAAPGQEAEAGRFLAALLIARIPLFFFQAVQSSLLPGLARLEAVGDRTGFTRLVRRLAGVVVALGLAAVVGAWVLGPWAVRLGFGADFALGRRDLALLAAAAGAVMLAHVLAHAAIALAGTSGSRSVGPSAWRLPS
jgi:O-antigen/teichoic acid export membrane protein